MSKKQRETRKSYLLHHLALASFSKKTNAVGELNFETHIAGLLVH